MLKSRDPVRWRDAWQIEAVTGKFISDWPMTEEDCVRERAVMIDVTPKKPGAHLDGTIMLMPGVVQVARWHSTDSFNYDAASEAPKLQPPKRQRLTALPPAAAPTQCVALVLESAASPLVVGFSFGRHHAQR